MKSLPGSSITGPALWAAARLRVAQWDDRARRPQGPQTEILLSHCRTAADTEFGRAHGLGRVRSYADFKQQVPLRSYADYEPYLTRMRQGARDVLWPGLIPYYGQSSGTSNTAALNKFLPISREQIGWQQKAGFDLVSRYLAMSGNRSFTGGYTLGLFPPGTIKHEGQVGVASNPGIMLHHMPSVTRFMTLPEAHLRDIENYDEKLTRIAESYLDHDVRSISGTTCWFSIMFDKLLAAAKASGRDVRTVSELWPNLCVLFGGGVYAEPYRRIINERVGRPITLMDNYNATEGGIFAATDRPNDDGLLMIPDRGVFFEFVPREQVGTARPMRLPLWSVEPGVDYGVVVTTSSGLFAYQMGDFVRFSQLFPHRMEFAGRASGMLSVTQELTTFIELEKAVAFAAARHPSLLVEFAASSEVGAEGTGKGRYVLFAEFEQPPADLAGFVAAFDEELCRQNRVYREHRANSVAILAPRLVPLVAGAAKKFMEAIGRQSVQTKFPRIVDERRRDLLRTLAQAAQATASAASPAGAPN